MYTREQCLALLTDRHIAVTANAGSGKTTVLVERFVRLLLQGVEIGSIVAITFTRKAAAEMRLRVAIRLEQEYNAMLADGNVRMATKVRNLRERLNTAQISTIHSFCANLIRNYPVEAKISPLFSIIDDFDANKLREEAIALLAERKLGSEQKDEKENYYTLFRIFGIDTIHSIAESLLRNLEQLEELKNIYTQSDEEIIELRNNIITEQYIKPLVPVLVKIEEAIESIRISGVKLNADVQKLMLHSTVLSELITECRKKESNFALIGNLFGQLYTTLFTTENKERKRLSNFAIENNIDNLVYGEGKILIHTSEFFSEVEGWDNDKDLLRYSRVILQFTQECEELIESEKIQLSSLDFNDVQKKASELLKSNEVRSDIQKRYTYLMIDEFQDTNQSQFRLTSHLVQQLSDIYIQDTQTYTNLYIVGDPKQSIYRFRGADVRVFESAKEAIKKMNGSVQTKNNVNINSEEIVLSEREKSGDIRLTTTFRLMPEIAFFVNSVCGVGMKKQTEGYFVGYDDTISSRRFPDNHKGSVSFIIGEKSDEYEAELSENSEQEELLAKHILSIVKSENPLQIDDRGILRSVSWTDIVILGRKNDALDTLATTLKEHNIPCHVPQGKRFYNRSEIRDIAAYISFLANPSDDFSLTVILRSPFFSVDDNELLEIMYYSDEPTLWEKSLKYSYSENVGNKLQFAISVLKEVLPLSARLSLPILLNTLYEKSCWYSVISYESDKERKIANVNKLISFARDFEAGGFKGLFEFAERLSTMIESETQESDAPLETVSNSIPLITIHASKGLEFPVVILYDTNSGQNFGMKNRVTLDERFGIVMKPVIVTENKQSTSRTKDFTTPIVKLASLEERLMENAELERLTYVALTRAKDHLIITANVSRKKDASIAALKGMFQFISPIFGEDFLLGKSIQLKGSLPIVRNNNVNHENFSLDIPIIKKVENVQLKDEDTNILKPTNQREDLLESINSVQQDEQISASKIMLYENDKQEYYLRYAIGLPHESKNFDTKSIDSDDGDSVTGSLYGKLLHGIMQQIPLWLNKAQSNDIDELNAVIENVCRAQEHEIRGEIKSRLLKESIAIVNTDIVRKYGINLLNAEYESQYYIPIDDDFYLAVFDCLVKNDKGEVEVWDWKTNHIGDKKSMELLFDKYKTQLEMYALFASYLYPHQDEFILRLLFTRKASVNCNDEEWIRSFVIKKDEIPSLRSQMYSHYKEIKSFLA